MEAEEKIAEEKTKREELIKEAMDKIAAESGMEGGMEGGMERGMEDGMEGGMEGGEKGGKVKTEIPTFPEIEIVVPKPFDEKAFIEHFDSENKDYIVKLFMLNHN